MTKIKNSKITLKNIFPYFICVSLLLISISIGIFNKNEELAMLILNNTLWLTIVFFSINNFRKRIALLLFLLAFFVFLMGRDITLFLAGKDWIGNYSISSQKHYNYTIFISLLGIFLGYLLTKNNSKNFNFTLKNALGNNKKYFTFLFYIVSIIYIIVLAPRVIYVQEYGYDLYYTEFTYSIPLLNSIIQQLFYVLFVFLLLTFPNQKEIKSVIFCFILVSVLFWFTGQRSTTILNLFIIIMYYVKRDCEAKTNQEERWIKKHYILYALILFPILLSVSYWYSFVRSGQIIPTYSIMEGVQGFFESQGMSKTIITEGYDKANFFPGAKIMYFLSPIINFFTQNRIVMMLTKGSSLIPYTVDYALSGYNFGATLSYLILGNSYLSGAGLGSSYIAEVYFAFGYFSIFIFSYFIGIVIKKLECLLSFKWQLSIFALLCYKYLLFMPRDNALGWITKGFNLTNIVLVVIFFFIVSFFSKKRVIS